MEQQLVSHYNLNFLTHSQFETAPGDYTAVMRSLTIPASPPLVTRVLINITSDNLFEGTEVFYVNLTRPSYGVILRDRSRRAAIVIPETEQSEILLHVISYTIMV